MPSAMVSGVTDHRTNVSIRGGNGRSYRQNP